MGKRLLTLVLSLGLILALAPAALAATVTGDQLRQVFPQTPAAEKTLTRGEFAALLGRAAGIPVTAGQGEAWYLPAVTALEEKGVIKGYPDGLLHPERPVTLLEGAVMASRALALPDGAAAPEVTVPLGREHWGYTPYAWLVQAGLLEPGQDISSPLTVDKGIAFLSRVFGNDPQAVKIYQAAVENQAKIKDLKFTGSMAMTMSPRPGAAGKLPPVSMAGRIESEICYPLNLHQKMEMTVNLPVDQLPPQAIPLPGGKLQMTVEQYLVDGNIYQKLEAPGMEKPQWLKLPKEALPDLEALVEQCRQAAGIPPELKDNLHFQYLGDGEENGHRVHRIAYYGLINDWQTLIKSLPGGLPPELQQALNQAGGILRSISLWGRESIGVEDSLTYASEMSGLVSFADEFQGEAVPFAAMTINLKVADYRYNSGIKIQVPAAALAAPELPLNPPPGTGKVQEP